MRTQDSFDMNHLPEPKNGESKGNGFWGKFRALSEILGRANFASRAGKTFGGKRDLYEALGYPRALRPQDLRDRYDRGDIAARVVDAYPKATWRKGAQVVEDEDPDIETAFEAEWLELFERLDVWSVFLRADTLANLGRYSVVLIGAEGNLDEELPPMRSQEDVRFLAVFGEDDANVSQWERNPEDPRFGLPVTYTLQRRAESSSQPSFAKTSVHWSRVLHIAEGTLDDSVYGNPRLARVWNRLDDLDKVVGGGSEAYWKRVDQGMHINLDKSLDIDTDDKKLLQDQVDEYINGLRRVLATKGVDINMLGSDVSAFSAQVTSIISIVSGATGIPQRILLGSERGELASTQDKSNWDERVQDRRDAFATPMIVRPFVDRLVGVGALPEPAQYMIQWPQFADLNKIEQAKVAVDWSNLNKNQGEVVVTANEIRDQVLSLEPFEEDDFDDGSTNPPPDDGSGSPEPTGARAAPKAQRLAGSQSGGQRTATGDGSQG